MINDERGRDRQSSDYSQQPHKRKRISGNKSYEKIDYNRSDRSDRSDPQEKRPLYSSDRSERPRRENYGDNRENGNRDYGNRENGNYENGNRDYGNRENGNREYGNRDYGNRDYGNRDYGNRDYNRDYNRENFRRGDDSRGYERRERNDRWSQGNDRPGYDQDRQGGYERGGRQGYERGQRSGYDRGDRPGYDRDRSSGYERGERSYERRGNERSNDRPFKKSFGQGNRSGGFNKFPNRDNRQFGDRQRRMPSPMPKPKQPFYKVEDLPADVPVRLNKYIANTGLCSRREADEYIQAGLITVNGELTTTLGFKVLPTDEIRYNGEKLQPERKVYILLNKPKDYVTSVDDPHAKRTVMELIKGACRERIYPVGRLDRMTTGVLLLTNDGELTKKLTHPVSNIRKIYQAQLDKNLKDEDLQTVSDGVSLDDGFIRIDGVNYISDDDKSVVGVELHSGRNRIVRRIFEHIGYKVVKLDRVYFAGLTKKGLKRGTWRYLDPKEVGFLKMMKA